MCIFSYMANQSPSTSDLVFRIKADFLKALAHPVRLAIIEYLKNRESSVGEMVNKLGVEQSGLSKHLALLRHAGILRFRQEKVTVYYSIRDHDIFKVLRPIAEILRKKLKESQGMLEHLGEV
ncbi:MAG: metalloregulator ArsR/SmtB family transcription factor [Elusimicrobiota bacterium]